jgi:hypothetical protein
VLGWGCSGVPNQQMLGQPSVTIPGGCDPVQLPELLSMRTHHVGRDTCALQVTEDLREAPAARTPDFASRAMFAVCWFQLGRWIIERSSSSSLDSERPVLFGSTGTKIHRQNP